jgi:SAM-dependent methyltransferase
MSHKRQKTLSSDLVCPYCRLALEPREKSYYCQGCRRGYALYTMDSLKIIDFSSLDTQQCECNRDGLIRCEINLEKQLPERLPNRKLERREPLTIAEELIRNATCQGNRILDLGCGEGRNSFLFAAENEACGLDICPKRMLLNEENALDKSYGTLIVSNAISLPFPEASFDIVICLEVIEHVTETRQLVAEINRVLKAGGRLIMSTPNLVSLGNRLGMILGKGLKLYPDSLVRGKGLYPLSTWREGGTTEQRYSFESIRYPEQPLHVRFFTFESLRKFLQQSGFKVEMEVGIGLVSPAISRFLHRIFKNWADDILTIAVKDRAL